MGFTWHISTANTSNSLAINGRLQNEGARERFHRQLACLSHGTDQNVAFNERLGVFALLPPGCPSNGVKDDTLLPLLPPRAVTNRQIRAASAPAVATPAEKG